MKTMKRHIKQTTGNWQLAIGKKAPLFVLLLLISPIFFTSCEDVIDVKLSEENLNLIGVEAEINTQDQPYVFLYQTLRVDQDIAYPGISGATVVLSDNATPANQIALAENPSKPGLYNVPTGMQYKGVVGREYTVTIQTGSVTLQAKDKLLSVSPIDSLVVEPSLRGEKRYLGVFIYSQEPKGIGNYYKWDVYVNDKLLADAQDLSVAWDKFVDGNYITKLEIYTDFYDTNKPEDRKIHLNDVVQVKQTSTSEFGYNYYYQLVNQSQTGGLFSVPPANIKSNFTSSDGKPVLGLFVARDVSTSKKVTVTQEIEDQLKK
jgi:hypothetical protein